MTRHDFSERSEHPAYSAGDILKSNPFGAARLSSRRATIFSYNPPRWPSPLHRPPNSPKPSARLPSTPARRGRPPYRCRKTSDLISRALWLGTQQGYSLGSEVTFADAGRECASSNSRYRPYIILKVSVNSYRKISSPSTGKALFSKRLNAGATRLRY